MSAKKNVDGEWTTVIKPKANLLNFNIAEVWRYRYLIQLFVRRDFVAVYKQTILGPAWFLIQPIMYTVVYTMVFGNLANLSSDGLPRILFYYSGIMLWQYFAQCLTKTSDTFVANASIFGKVYFPRLTVPISVVITSLITFAIQFALFAGFLIYFMVRGFSVNPNLWILSLPLLLIAMAALGLGSGIIISSVTTKYQDLRHLLSFGVNLWMYATPVVYPLSQVPTQWRWVFVLNPMSAIIESFRYAFTGVGTVSTHHLAATAGMIVVVLLLGVVLFNRVERTFMDVV